MKLNARIEFACNWFDVEAGSFEIHSYLEWRKTLRCCPCGRWHRLASSGPHWCRTGLCQSWWTWVPTTDSERLHSHPQRTAMLCWVSHILLRPMIITDNRMNESIIRGFYWFHSISDKTWITSQLYWLRIFKEIIDLQEITRTLKWRVFALHSTCSPINDKLLTLDYIQ